MKRGGCKDGDLGGTYLQHSWGVFFDGVDCRSDIVDLNLRITQNIAGEKIEVLKLFYSSFNLILGQGTKVHSAESQATKHHTELPM
jgi:hypothetical protein